ncbi:NAD(P)-dependent alcohol dehydrogenase [Pseudochryseolinea flava]|uniref:NAD(P)-dependent alcohol dehydrogenase n=2 Tax=Pseudochryseolinea flava TaxID=2059302 RepID=A0A364Y1C7_9BACT|nr:NAD(P)-dependent alcohol dehydrogenase [Pseudochryseolinea flava]
MKAICYTRYGNSEVLKFEDVPMPMPNENAVRIKVEAACINSWDWDMVRGKPFIVRAWGLFSPKYKIPGADVAGRVDAVGAKVTKFKIGDAVFGDLANDGWGSFAEYACADEKSLALMPHGLTYEEACCIPQAGMMALQSVRDHGRLQTGQHMLFNGAGGGVGTFAVQLAKSIGAEVTIVDKADKFPLLKSLGADHCIDYTQQDFVENGLRYDLIVDVVSNRPLAAYKKSLTPTGKFLMVGGSMKAIFQAMFLSSWISSKEQKLGMMAYEINKDLDYMARLMQERKLRAVIDTIFPLEQTCDAFAYYAAGDVKGKIVIKIQ